MNNKNWLLPASTFPGIVFSLFLLLPLGAILWKTSWLDLKVWTSPYVITALKVSLITSTSAAIIFFVLGLPIAYLGARLDFKGKKIIDSLFELPLVLPPSVAGLALLLAFGRMGLLGQHLNSFGITIPFTQLAVILAQVFVAGPIFIKTARTGFLGVNPLLEKVAYTLGKSPWETFTQVTLPLAYPSLLSGLVMAWTRALGEFGATIMFAGNLPGKTQTLPLAIYMGLERDLDEAVAIAALMLITSFTVLFLLKFWSVRREHVGHSL